MSLLPMFIILGALSAAQGPPPDDAEKTARDYFETLRRDRERITSGYLEWTSTMDAYSRSEELVGSERTYRLWFDKTRRRMDLDEVRPRAPDHALHVRYAFDGKAYRRIDADRPDVVVQELTTAFLGDEPPKAMLPEYSVDPRVIGINGMEFGINLHYRLDKCGTFDPNSTFQVDRARIEGLEALELSIRNPKNHQTFIVPQGAILPARMTTRFGSREPGGGPPYPLLVEVESEVATWPNDRGERFEFPRTIKARRLDNGTVVLAETLRVRKVNFNVPIPASVLTWKGLQPPIGAALAINREYQRSETKEVQWDGERFVSVVVPPLSSNDPGPDDDDTATANAASPFVSGSILRTSSFVAAGSASLLAMIAAFLKLSRRRAAQV